MFQVKKTSFVRYIYNMNTKLNWIKKQIISHEVHIESIKNTSLTTICTTTYHINITFALAKQYQYQTWESYWNEYERIRGYQSDIAAFKFAQKVLINLIGIFNWIWIPLLANKAEQYQSNANANANLDRILNTERGTLTPLVFSTTGGMAPECERFNKRLAELISTKSGEAYSHVMRHVRTRLRFALLRATLIAIRGSRGWRRSEVELNVDEISFNLMPVPRGDN